MHLKVTPRQSFEFTKQIMYALEVNGFHVRTLQEGVNCVTAVLHEVNLQESSLEMQRGIPCQDCRNIFGSRSTDQEP